jgi:hypothetical protein
MSFITVFLIQKGALQNPAEATIGGDVRAYWKIVACIFTFHLSM